MHSKKPEQGVVYKVLNNNLIITIDLAGRELVLMGRGLGWHLKPHDPIDYTRVEKTYVLDQDTDAVRAQQVLTEAPFAVVQAVTNAVEEAAQTLGKDLSRTLPVAIIDHVSFVLERLDKGLRIPAAPMPEISVLYPEEAQAAVRIRDAIGEALGVTLPPEEAVFLTMHLINFTRDEPNGAAALMFRRVQNVVAIVEEGLRTKLDTSTFDYARFVLHIKFLLQRLLSSTMLHGTDSSFYDLARHSYPRSHGLAERVKAYVLEGTGAELTREEMLYLVMHVERLSQRVQAE